jgi:hypothetical protein
VLQCSLGVEDHDIIHKKENISEELLGRSDQATTDIRVKYLKVHMPANHLLICHSFSLQMKR